MASAPGSKKARGKAEKPEAAAAADTVQTTNEELRSKLSEMQVELQQERGKVPPAAARCVAQKPAHA